MLAYIVRASNILTGWLRNKCPTGQKAVSLQPEELLISKFQVFRGRDLLTILENFHEKHHCFKNYSW